MAFDELDVLALLYREAFEFARMEGEDAELDAIGIDLDTLMCEFDCGAAPVWAALEPLILRGLVKVESGEWLEPGWLEYEVSLNRGGA